MKLSSYDFLFHRNLNMRNNKGQIPLSKTREYSSDVHQKIAELHNIQSGCKKTAKELTIRAIIKKL